MELSASPIIQKQSPKFFGKPYSVSIIEVALLLIIIVIGFWYFVMPKKNKLASEVAQLAQLKKDSDAVASDKLTLQSLIGQVQSDPQDVSRLDEALPLENSTIRLQMLINKFGQDAGVTVNQANISSNGQDIAAGNKPLLADPFNVARTLQNVPISLTAVGSYDQLKAFLQKIEDNARIMDVKGLNLSAGTLGQSLTLNLDLVTYYFAPQN